MGQLPRGRYQQKQWDARHAAILEALDQLSGERGFANVTMDDLADRVGISKATLYQHFESKDAMLAELMLGHEDAFLASLDAIAEQPPVEQLKHIMRTIYHGHITPLRGLVSLGEGEALPVFRSSPQLMARHDQIIARLARIIREGQADSSIAPDLDVHTIVLAMLALSRVTLGQYQMPAIQEHLSPQEVQIDQMLLLFERAIRPARPD